MSRDYSKRVSELENRIGLSDDEIEPIVYRVRKPAAIGGGLAPIKGWKISGAGLRDKKIIKDNTESEDHLWQRVEKYMDDNRKPGHLFIIFQIVEQISHESVCVTYGKSD